MERIHNKLTTDFLSKLWDNTRRWYNGPLYKQLRQFHYKSNRGNFSYKQTEEIPKLLLHGTTTQFLDEINKKGLLPQKARNNETSLTDNMLMAELYAFLAVNYFGGEPAVLIVDARYIRYRFKRGYTWWFFGDKPLVILTHREFRYGKAISPNRIKDWYIPASFFGTLLALLQILNGIDLVDERERQERESLESLLEPRKPVPELLPSSEVTAN